MSMTGTSPGAAEIIVKEGVTFLEDKHGAASQPQFIMLCSAESFDWLSRYFARLAESARKREAKDRDLYRDHPDPDDHQHLEDDAPCNHMLSDSLCVRIGSLTSWNRPVVLEKYDISPATARRGSFTTRARDLYRRAEEYESWHSGERNVDGT